MSNPEYPLRLTTDREKQLLELTQKSYDVEFLTREDLLLVIKNRLALLPLTDLGRACLEDMYDRLLVCGRERSAQFYCSLSALKAEIEKNRDRQNPIGYITGGLEGFHHVVLLEGLVVSRVGSMIIGLEDPSYISSKGRSPIFSLEEKISLWMYLAPTNSSIFVIPPKPAKMSANFYYDSIVQYLGLWQNPNVVFVGSSDDSMSVQRSHRRRATPENALFIEIGYPHLHTREYFAF